MRRIPPLSVALFALAVIEGVCFSQPPVRKLSWQSPCSFAYLEGEKIVGPYQSEERHRSCCDYLLVNYGPKAQKTFNEASLDAEERFLAEAESARKRYESEKDALLAEALPEKVAVSDKLPAVAQVKARAEGFRKLIDILNKRGGEIARPFGGGKEYLKPFQERIDLLKKELAKEKGEKAEAARKQEAGEAKKKADEAQKKVFETQKGQKGGSGTKLKRFEEDQKKGKADVEKDVYGVRSSQGSTDPKLKNRGLSQLKGASATGSVGSAADYSKYQRGGASPGKVAPIKSGALSGVPDPVLQRYNERDRKDLESVVSASSEHLSQYYKKTAPDPIGDRLSGTAIAGPLTNIGQTAQAGGRAVGNVLGMKSDSSQNFQRGCAAHQFETLQAARNALPKDSNLEVKALDAGTFFPHHAVIVYPKGTDYKETGVVLDAWVKQSPAPGDMTMGYKSWSRRFWFERLAGEEIND